MSATDSVQKTNAKGKIIFVLSYYKKMSEKTLKLDKIRANKKEFHKSKQPIDIDLIKVDQIVVSDKVKHSDDGFKYFSGYKKGEIVKRLCIILPQMSGYIKYFQNGGKNISFMIKDDEVWEKYEEIWDVIKKKLSIKFYSDPLYDQKYLKVKVREFDDKVKVNFLGHKVPKEKEHYICIACITIDSVMRRVKKNYPPVYLEESKHKIKKTKMVKFVNTYLKSESESESDTELMVKLKSDSDTE